MSRAPYQLFDQFVRDHGDEGWFEAEADRRLKAIVVRDLYLEGRLIVEDGFLVLKDGS